ncbi:MAG TPA: CpsD/CapB family tyrosine-protein kinase [Candidatus Dormibacteraeota bacterium]|nr:CpsD/CapB family tyrosine-protein kinase [Candidatus Dormibacteraeota bacterium]
MSRIHDALKKAAEERASQPPASSSQTFVDVTEGISRSAQAWNELDIAPTNGSGNAGKQPSFRFEQLLKRCAHPKWALDPRMSVFGGTDSKKIGAEPFRTLRSRLSQIASTRMLKRILITSSVPAEGKTFVAANLAQSIIRQPDRRVLLIDADLRASRLHVALGAPSRPGLTDYLRGEADEYAIIQCGPDENLCFIPGGNEVSNPSELLPSDRMRHLLDVVTPMFDFVIVDSPPATPVHDPSLLADLCDGVLFVVRAGVTDVELAEKAVAEFREKNLLGVVLNGAEREAAYGQYYSHYTGG